MLHWGRESENLPRNLLVQSPVDIENPMRSFAGDSAAYFNRLTRLAGELDHASIDQAIQLIADAWRRGNQIITLGNGGSSLTALHFINDWNKSISSAGNRPFRGRSLVDN